MATIKRREDRGNRWEVRFRDPEGKQRARLFDRRVDAEQFITGTEHSKLTGTYVDPALGRTTFARFVAEDYRPTMVGLEPSTRVRDESYLRTHILPVFGARPLATIDYSACQAWVNEMATRKAPATVVKAAQIMGKGDEDGGEGQADPPQPNRRGLLAHRDRVRGRLPHAGAGGVPGRRHGRLGPRYRALSWLGCYGGARIGELLALRWTDLDFLRRTVAVSRKVIEVSGAGMVEGATKTKAGRRTVTLPRRVVTELEQHQAAFGSSSLVFTSPEGNQVRANNLRRRQVGGSSRPGWLGGVHLPRHEA